MNIPRRIQLLSAAGALSLMSLTGLIAAAPAHALTVAPDRATSTVSFSYYTWWIPVVMKPGSGSGCRAGTLTGYSAQFVGDTSVSVQIYENTNYGWQQLNLDGNNPDAAVVSVDPSTGTLLPSPPVSWAYPAGFGTGQYEAWLTDGAGRGGATSFTSCP